jgi:phytoene synthase
MTSKDQTKIDFKLDDDFNNILTNPILDIAARFWDYHRYQAFRICYRSMRRIDDLVDHKKASTTQISREEAEKSRLMIFDWLQGIRNKDISDRFRGEFLGILEKFEIPFWPWERFYASMVYDLGHSGYSSLLSFLRYAEGAAVAPASVFMHLCGVSKEGGTYHPAGFNIRLAARPLALFSYLVHIIRDFQKDQLNNLCSFADNLLAQYALTRDDLRKIAEGGPITHSFRKLIAAYISFAEYYRKKARGTIDDIRPLLGPRYQLSLEIIYHLYLQIFERIDPHQGRFTGPELNPPPGEVRSRIQQTIDSFTPVSQ